MRISYSLLDTFKTCPLKYKFQEIDKIRAPKNVEQVFGSLIHTTLKYMFERSPLYPTLDQVIDFFRNLWDQYGKIFENEEIYFKEGISLLEKFYKKNHPWNFNVVELESRFTVDLEDPKTKDKHVVAGIIDRIDKNHTDDNDFYEIIDYKTSKRMPGQNNLDQDLQMSIYQIGLLQKWPHLSPERIRSSFYFLKHGEKVSTARNNEQLENTKKFILNEIKDISERINDNYNFPPTPSALCDWCGYKQMCPMWRHLYQTQISKIKDQKELDPVIKEYFELKEQNEKNDDRLNELKSIIYGFMDEQKVERVFGEKGYLTRKIQERFSYDLEKIKEILEPLGKWQEILSADEKKLEKILSSLPNDIQEKILSLRITKRFPILTVSKKKPQENLEK